MPKIWIEKDEVYPVYSISLEEQSYLESSHGVEQWHIGWIQDVLKDYAAVQEFLKQLDKGE